MCRTAIPSPSTGACRQVKRIVMDEDSIETVNLHLQTGSSCLPRFSLFDASAIFRATRKSNHEGCFRPFPSAHPNFRYCSRSLKPSNIASHDISKTTVITQLQYQHEISQEKLEITVLRWRIMPLRIARTQLHSCLPSLARQ